MWVNIEKEQRFPPAGQPVVIWTRIPMARFLGKGWHLAVAEYIPGNGCTRDAWHGEYDGAWLTEGVTHWRPIESPAEEITQMAAEPASVAPFYLTKRDIEFILHRLCCGETLAAEDLTEERELVDRLKDALVAMRDSQMVGLDADGPGTERLHLWWGLSYASYLTIPRTFLQSLPDGMQNRWAALLEEMDDFARRRDFCWPGAATTVEVKLRRAGRFVKDALSDYDRGRRRIFGTKE